MICSIVFQFLKQTVKKSCNSSHPKEGIVYVIQSNEIKCLHDWNVGRNRTYWLTSNDLPLAALVKMLSMSEPVLSEVGTEDYSIKPIVPSKSKESGK